jgi:ABC-type transport system substrate-binding protein
MLKDSMPRRPTILLLVLLALTAGCSGGEPASGYDEARTIRFGTYAPVHKFDPHLTDGGVSFSSYNILVYDGLLIGNPESLWHPLPNLATEWNWITETTIEFRLRNDVHFSDGVHFDAAVAKPTSTGCSRFEGHVSGPLRR